ncbi:hypothetical protein ACFQZZ_18430 [Nocardia sp. GCM10030253]|uniref:hypothetical protein n=1 Tax=Nocardia sp. GCM10030253 TaxID=3273404 RepID=UPI00363DCCDA
MTDLTANLLESAQRHPDRPALRLGAAAMTYAISPPTAEPVPAPNLSISQHTMPGRCTTGATTCSPMQARTV